MNRRRRQGILAGALLLVVLGPSCRPTRVQPPPAPPVARQADEAAPPVTKAGPAEPERPQSVLPFVIDGRASLLATDLTELPLESALVFPAAIFYFSTGCPHCWNVAGEFQSACDTMAGQGVSCIAIASSASRLSGVREFADQTGLVCPAFVDYSGAFRDAHGMTSTPTVLYADASGAVAHVADPFYRGAALSLRMAVAEDRGEDPQQVWDPAVHVGSRACAPCHESEYNAWLLSPHSVAIRSLPGDSHTDPACLDCHATATGAPGGFVDLVTTGHLRDVGCEACHGASGGHTPQGMAPDRPEPTSSCTRCHDAGHSIAFDLTRSLPGIDHALAETLPPERWNARRVEVEEGRFQRTALQIPAGNCAGSESCVACHAEVHESWAAGPHGRARATLVEAGSQRDPACLACHVPREPCDGEVRGRRSGGVSCEACHGPAAEHVESAGQAPPRGISSGHAAECVVEPLCQRCHTAVRDPSWELAPRLSGVHP